MRIDILTVVPELLASPLNESILKRAQEKGLVEIHIHNIRDYTEDKHRTTDDYPFGGEAGMVMKIEPIYRCIEALKAEREYDEVIYTSPDGIRYDQHEANRLSTLDNLIILCGHYKGIDYRIREHLVTREISIGDYVLTGGELAACIQRALDRGGNLVIPAFAVGRTQEMLYAIREIKQRGLVTGHDHFPVYVDSPLAVEATGIFLQCDPTDFDDETRAILKQGVNPIWFDGLKLSVSSDESKLINTDPQPKVILSASGMCEAGRIRHHLKHNLWRKESVILFVGYQAEGSLGWKLENGTKSVKLFGEDIAVNAEIAMLHGTSGHADKEGLLNWLAGFREKPKMVFVNHGDDSSCKAFCATLKSMGYHADAPYSGTEYDLITGKLTTYTEGVKIDRAAAFKGTQRAKQIYEDMVAAAEALLALVQARRLHHPPREHQQRQRQAYGADHQSD